MVYMDIFKDLNEQQEKAVKHMDGPCLVVAGAGSGKTSVLTSRIVNLINNGVDINNIYLCNVSSDYLYTIDRLFKYYNIPINLDMDYSNWKWC